MSNEQAVATVKGTGVAARTDQTSQGRMAVSEVVSHVAMVREVMERVMKKDMHYGTIPGTPKPTLYKPGGEALCLAFRIAQSFITEDLSTADAIRYRITCVGTHQLTGTVLGSGMGEASSGEEKYKWRGAVCDEEWEETPAHLRRTKFSKYQGNVQKKKQVRTEPADLANTVLKMATKRAFMAMVLNVTAASDVFTQDIEDLDESLRESLVREESRAGQEHPQVTYYDEAEFKKNLPAWVDAKKAGRKISADALTAKVHGAGTPFTAEQEKALREALDKAQPTAEEATPAASAAVTDVTPKNEQAPVATFEEVADKLLAAETMDALNDAAGLISLIADEAQRTELDEMFERLKEDKQ